MSQDGFSNNDNRVVRVAESEEKTQLAMSW